MRPTAVPACVEEWRTQGMLTKIDVTSEVLLGDCPVGVTTERRAW